MKLDLDATADVLRRNSGTRREIDTDGYYVSLNSRRSRWRGKRPPKAFASGRYRFFVLRDKLSDTPRWILWGEHRFVTFPIPDREEPRDAPDH